MVTRASDPPSVASRPACGQPQQGPAAAGSLRGNERGRQRRGSAMGVAVLRPVQPQALPGPTRPLLNPALYRLARDRSTMQLGLDCPSALLLPASDPSVRFTLSRLDGRHEATEILLDAAAAGLDTDVVRRLLSELDTAGVLLSGDPTVLSGLGGPAEVDRLAPDLASMSLLTGAGAGADAPTTVRRRQRALVVVHGATRVGVPLAATLAAAGVGRVSVVDRGRVLRAEAAPGGVAPADEHRPRRSAAHDAVRRAAPTVRTTVAPGERPELAVLCEPWPDPDLLLALQAAATPHLLATVRETTGVIGPLVSPGQTGCLDCVEQHRQDRDAGWPALLAQLTGRRRQPGDALDGPLALLVAAAAAMQALAFLDADGAVPRPVLEASLELRLPDWRLRRRCWPAHPRCRCVGTLAQAG